MVSQAELILSVITLWFLHGLISNLLEMVWVPLMVKVFVILANLPKILLMIISAFNCQAWNVVYVITCCLSSYLLKIEF